MQIQTSWRYIYIAGRASTKIPQIVMFLQSNAGRVAESSSLCDDIFTAKPLKNVHTFYTTRQITTCNKGSTKYSTPFYTLFYIFLLKIAISLTFFHLVSIFLKMILQIFFFMNSINRKILLRGIMWGQIEYNNELIQASFYISRYWLGSYVHFLYPALAFYELRISEG